MSATASAFSSSEAVALERQIDEEDPAVTLEQVWNETHRKVCSRWIRQHGYKRVCLQFPDYYLPHSHAICESLKVLLMDSGGGGSGGLVVVQLFILADTSYGSCCVDEIAASHVDADSLIHFGNACRSKVSRLPVLFMFPELSVDLAQMLGHLESMKHDIEDKEFCVYLDIGYHYLLELRVGEVEEESLSTKLKENLVCRELHIEAYPPAEDSKSNGEHAGERICLFVGAENSRFSNLSLTTKATRWFIYDPAADTIVERNPLTANYMRRRYYYIEKCKDARVLGLIVATLSAEGYLDVVTRMQDMAKQRGVRTQIISVGRINPAKLANFLEIDCFVLIGCQYNNMYTSKEFYKPIVSVFEAEMALNPAWHMKYPEAYVTDFKELLPDGRHFIPFDDKCVLENDVSLVSGQLRNASFNNDVDLAHTSALSERQQAMVSRGKMEMMTTNTGLTFEDRTWKGLDQALGQTEPAKLEKGLSGIPIKYTHD